MKYAFAWLSFYLMTNAITANKSAARDYPIQPVPFTSVKLDDAFWTPRLETNRIVTVWYDFKKCEETGRIDNFAKAGKLMEGPFRGTPFDDSDVFKVIEGASYSLALRPDPELDRYLDDLIRKIAAAQETDGYLYSARTIDPKCRIDFFGPERWTKLAGSHELYNVGHLYEAAVAHFNATGKTNLLTVARKSADLICQVFGPAGNQRKDPPGHQEIEIGLSKLFRATGDQKYLDQAKFFLEIRGQVDRGTPLRGLYQQDHLPVTAQTEAVGHAVRACYMYAGMADVAALTGDEKMLKAIDTLWDNVVSKKLYLTGGVGARHAGEAFGDNYELPNASAYNETCAAIACALWNHRMFLLHGDSKYIDVFERILYNGFLSGVAQSGDQFFYPNPLAYDGRSKFNHGTAGRAPWFGCSCCPVNVVRVIPSIPGWVYAVENDNLYVNLFAGGTGDVTVGGSLIKLRQSTRYPWDGTISFEIDPAKTKEFSFRIRIPGWARGEPLPGDLYRYSDSQKSGWQIDVNGAKTEAKVEKGYAVLHREWKAGDKVTLKLEMPVRQVVANKAVVADRDRVALERGPVVYCLEADDNDGSVHDLVLDSSAAITTMLKPELLNGVVALQGKARRLSRGGDGTVKAEPADFIAIPYYAWAHRHIGEMTVWMAATDTAAITRPAPTLTSQARVEASHAHENDSLQAVNDLVIPASSIDHDIPRFTWWDHKGTDEWIAYRFKAPAEVASVEVYWFDDSGRGQCRVPASWRVEYLEGQDWKPVEQALGCSVEKDRFNKTGFKPVKAAGLRLSVKLQPGFSGGILEWQVK